jgi:hypothetical protein
MSSKTLVAQLPPMTAGDFARFEQEGGVWGQQRSIRRRQVNVALTGSVAVSVVGSFYTKVSRGNTWLVVGMTLPVFALSGFMLGHAAGISQFPSVANNKETTMMRRVWWAKECAKNWDMSQISESSWKARYPHEPLPK